MLILSKITKTNNDVSSTAKLLLVECAKQISDIEFNIEKKKSGMPYIRELPNYFCSISHSGKYVLSAISDTTLGIDIEEIKPRKESVLNEIANQDEILIVGNENTLLKIWCIKESVFKSLNLPIKINFKDMTIIRTNNSNTFEVKMNKNNLQKFYVKIIENPKLIIAVCNNEYSFNEEI